MWRTVGENIADYRSYPRLVGETGGKDFLIAHASADPDAVATAIVRGGYRVSGAEMQRRCPGCTFPTRCGRYYGSACRHRSNGIRMGDVADFRNFMGAVIDRAAFKKISGYIEAARQSTDASILAGGGCDDSEGYFIRPTLIQATKPDYRTMCEEIFGPVVTLYVYPEKEWQATLKLVDETSPYALTGAVFATDRKAIDDAALSSSLRGGQLLHQRQAHRRRGRPAAIRRGAGERNERQSRLHDESVALGQRPHASRKPSFPRPITVPFMRDA